MWGLSLCATLNCYVFERCDKNKMCLAFFLISIGFRMFLMLVLWLIAQFQFKSILKHFELLFWIKGKFSRKVYCGIIYSLYITVDTAIGKKKNNLRQHNGTVCPVSATLPGKQDSPQSLQSILIMQGSSLLINTPVIIGDIWTCQSPAAARTVSVLV